jgi:hypothetical protein
LGTSPDNIRLAALFELQRKTCVAGPSDNDGRRCNNCLAGLAFEGASALKSATLSAAALIASLWASAADMVVLVVPIAFSGN